MRWRTALLLSVLPLALALVLRIDARALAEESAIRSAWLAGELPGWDPHTALGVPLVGATATGPWYPPNALKVLLPPELAHPSLAFLALFLAGVGTWRRLGWRGAALAQLGGAALALLR